MLSMPTFLRHILIRIWLTIGRAASAVASLGFDSDVDSIAAGWIPGDAGGRPRAVVACSLDGKYFPVIMHFFPAKR